MRRLAVFAGGLSLGVFLAQYLLRGGWALAGALAGLLLGCLSLALPWEWRRRGVAFCAAAALGLGYSWLYARQVQRPCEALAGSEGVFTATLCEYPVRSDYGGRVTVRLEGLPGKAVFYGGEELLKLVPGQTIAGRGRFQSAVRVRDEDITRFTSKGVFLLVYGRGGFTAAEGSAGSPRWYPVRLAHAMGRQIETLFQGDAAGFLRGILTGDKTGLTERAYAALSEAGLAHVVAVSGMHCGFLMTLAGLFLQNRRYRALLGIPLLAFYAALTGGSPSVLRACVMLSLPMLAVLVRREDDGPTSLLAALMLILLANPFAAASVSLQLSFAAMAGLLWVTPGLYRRLLREEARGRGFRILAASISATLGAMAFTAPLAGYYFGSLVLITPLSGFLCVWAASGIFLLGMAAVLLSFLSMPLGRLLALPAGALAEYVLGIAGLLGKLPYHALYFANPFLKYWLAYVYILFLAAYAAGRTGRRKYRLAAVLAAAALLPTVWLGEARYGSDLDVVVLDVGQGQSVVLASEGTFALVDCGSGNRWKSPGETAAHQLAAMGCKRLDWLILTHYDQDHVSGVTGLLTRLGAETVLVPEEADDGGWMPVVLETARDHGAEVRFITEEERLDFGRGSLRLFPPLGDAGDNERGLTVLAAAGEKEFLITGDMDASTEEKLLAAYRLPDIEGMMAGHHGSKYATSQALLETLKPEIVCVSVGGNSYGHPTEETLLRLARQGCEIYRTDLHGRIHLAWNQEETHGDNEESPSE